MRDKKGQMPKSRSFRESALDALRGTVFVAVGQHHEGQVKEEMKKRLLLGKVRIPHNWDTIRKSQELENFSSWVVAKFGKKIQKEVEGKVKGGIKVEL